MLTLSERLYNFTTSSQNGRKSSTSEGQVGALRVRIEQSIDTNELLTSSSDTVILSSLANPKNERTLSLAFVSAPRLRREGDEVSTQLAYRASGPQQSKKWFRKTNNLLSHMLSNLETSSAAY
jgi:hypothetical protein